VIPLGPFVTAALWLAILLAIGRHNATATERDATQLPFFELVPIAVAIGMLQLLLDLHRPWLGDLVIVVVHTVGAAVLWIRRRRAAAR